MPGAASSQRVEAPIRRKIVDVRFENDRVSFIFADQSVFSAPLAWYPRLERATAAQRNHFELLTEGVHWPDVDEDLSVEGILRGEPDPVLREHQANWRSPLLA